MYSFDNVLGNQEIVRRLQSAVTANKISHAYIFEGEEGIGKRTLANALAKTLQCEARGAEPCGVCVSCRTYESGNHPDVFNVASEKKSIGVEEVREQIVREMETKPYLYPYKIFLISQPFKFFRFLNREA